MQELISVIMPIYKVHTEVLCEAIESIKKQIYINWELLLINDGSNGDEESVCKSFCDIDKRIKYYRINNGGASTARNKGLENAEGKYVVFVDADDTLLPDYLSTLYRAMIAGNVDVVIASCNHIYGTEIKEKKKIIEDSVTVKDELLECLYYMKQPYEELEITAVWGKLYLTSIAKSVCFNSKLHIGEDFDFNYRYFSKIKKGKYLSYQGYNYYIRDNSAIRSLFNERKRDTFFELDRLTKNNKDNIGYVSRVINIAIVLLIMAFNSNCDDDFENISMFIKKYRLKVIMNRKCRKKVKVALLFSYIGFNNMVRLYKAVS